jgi:hypothetical protein
MWLEMSENVSRLLVISLHLIHPNWLTTPVTLSL